jgi:hypothetical protein
MSLVLLEGKSTVVKKFKYFIVGNCVLRSGLTRYFNSLKHYEQLFLPIYQTLGFCDMRLFIPTP